MPSKLAFIFPGQGAQSVGMVAGFLEQFPQFGARYAQAGEALNLDLLALVTHGPADELNRTQNTQPALLAASVAIWDVWNALAGRRPGLLAGHSFGEYSALVCAGALDFKEGIRLVADRGRFMQEAVPAGTGGMAAVLGLDRERLDAVCVHAAEHETVQCANLNAPGQIVISGSTGALERAAQGARSAGAKRVMPLAVSVPAHSALMRPAAMRFQERIAGVAFTSPEIPVIHNVDVVSHATPAGIRAALVAQLECAVRWQETIEYFAATGVTHVVECGPGKVLSPLVKRCAPHLQTFSLSGPSELRAVLAELEARCND